MVTFDKATFSSSKMARQRGRSRLFEMTSRTRRPSPTSTYLTWWPKEVSPEYLFWVFSHSDEGQRRILEHFRGSAQGGITKDFAAGTQVPVAPRGLQDLIAQLAEAVDRKRATAQSHLAASRRAMERFRQAVLAAACSGRRPPTGVMTTRTSLLRPSSTNSLICAERVEMVDSRAPSQSQRRICRSCRKLGPGVRRFDR